MPVHIIGSILFRAVSGVVRGAVRGARGVSRGARALGGDEVDAGIAAAVAELQRIHRQVPFATAKALNATAVDVQKFTIDSLLPSKFTLRSRSPGSGWWKPRTAKGINIAFASKRKLESRVGSRADWLPQHEQGGIKTPKGRTLAIVSKEWRGDARAILKKSKRPAQVLRGKPAGLRARPFVLRGKRGDGGIYVRTGKERGPLMRLFSFERSARIRPTLDFKKEGYALAQKVFPAHFDLEFKKAIATAR